MADLSKYPLSSARTVLKRQLVESKSLTTLLALQICLLFEYFSTAQTQPDEANPAPATKNIMDHVQKTV